MIEVEPVESMTVFEVLLCQAHKQCLNSPIGRAVT